MISEIKKIFSLTYIYLAENVKAIDNNTMDWDKSIVEVGRIYKECDKGPLCKEILLACTEYLQKKYIEKGKENGQNKKVGKQK